MTAAQWRERNGKSPWPAGDGWYWALDRGDTEPGDEDFVLPEALFARLPGPVTYPDVKVYATHDTAVAAFVLAYYAAREQGALA